MTLGSLQKNRSSILNTALCGLVLWASAVHAEGWNVEKITQTEAVSNLCTFSGETSDPATRAMHFTSTQADGHVSLCYHDKDSFDGSDKRYRYHYTIHYALQKTDSSTVLHSESEMMAWPMSYAIDKDSLVFRQYWRTRKVKTHAFYCDRECHLMTQCRAERLPSDVKDIVVPVKPFLETEQTRAKFLLAEDPRCKDDDVAIAAVAGLGLAMSGNEKIVSQSRDLAFEKCWPATQQRLLKELQDGGYFATNACPDLKKKKALSAADARKCAAAK